MSAACGRVILVGIEIFKIAGRAVGISEECPWIPVGHVEVVELVWTAEECSAHIIFVIFVTVPIRFRFQYKVVERGGILLSVDPHGSFLWCSIAPCVGYRQVVACRTFGRERQWGSIASDVSCGIGPDIAVRSHAPFYGWRYFYFGVFDNSAVFVMNDPYRHRKGSACEVVYRGISLCLQLQISHLSHVSQIDICPVGACLCIFWVQCQQCVIHCCKGDRRITLKEEAVNGQIVGIGGLDNGTFVAHGSRIAVRLLSDSVWYFRYIESGECKSAVKYTVVLGARLFESSWRGGYIRSSERYRPGYLWIYAA